MMFPDLPEPRTTDESITHAKAYADAIRNSHKLKRLKSERLKVDASNAPTWFARILDIDIKHILWRIDYLDNYHGKCDPRSYALDTHQRMRVVMDLMRNFLNPDLMHWHNVDRVYDWLTQDEETLNENPTG
ncbi:hypothetical protein ACF1CY_004673 [Providencia rettgeri]